MWYIRRDWPGVLDGVLAGGNWVVHSYMNGIAANQERSNPDPLIWCCATSTYFHKALREYLWSPMRIVFGRKLIVNSISSSHSQIRRFASTGGFLFYELWWWDEWSTKIINIIIMMVVRLRAWTGDWGRPSADAGRIGTNSDPQRQAAGGRTPLQRGSRCLWSSIWPQFLPCEFHSSTLN